MSEKFYNDEYSIRETLRDMKIGDTVIFPVNRLTVVRATASNLGLEMSRHYATKTSRKDSTMRVKRTY